MLDTPIPTSNHPYRHYVDRILGGKTLLPDSPRNVQEVVGILHSYGIVLDAYSITLCSIADRQFLVQFPFFKYFVQGFNLPQLIQHLWHNRINFEYAEYCMRGMLWHGGGGLDQYLDSDGFKTLAQQAITAKIRHNPILKALNLLFPDFLLEQVRQLAYTSGLGQFWRVMSDIFLDLSAQYEAQKIQSIPDVVEFIKTGLVQAATKPIVYRVSICNQTYDILPSAANLTFLADTAIPYVEAIFFRGTPFQGTVSFNAQANQISPDQGQFAYGALYADPLPIGGSGIPPTLLMQDMRHYLPDYLHQIYLHSPRQEADLLVKICESFQKSMFCVTNAALVGLLPCPLDSPNPEDQQQNRQFLEGWMDRLTTSQLDVVQHPSAD